MVTIPGRYDGPPIYLDHGCFYEVDLTIGTQMVHPNALDLLDAVITAALAIDPERAAETLAEAVEALPCQCRGCRGESAMTPFEPPIVSSLSPTLCPLDALEPCP